MDTIKKVDWLLDIERDIEQGKAEEEAKNAKLRHERMLVLRTDTAKALTLLGIPATADDYTPDGEVLLKVAEHRDLAFVLECNEDGYGFAIRRMGGDNMKRYVSISGRAFLMDADLRIKELKLLPAEVFVFKMHLAKAISDLLTLPEKAEIKPEPIKSNTLSVDHALIDNRITRDPAWSDAIYNATSFKQSDEFTIILLRLAIRLVVAVEYYVFERE